MSPGRESQENQELPTKVDAYIERIRSTQYNDLSGDLVHRISGTFSLRRLGKHDVDVTYVGSTHEIELDRIVASAEEQAFIRRHAFAGTPGTFFIEQGDYRYMKDDIEPVIDDILASHPDMKADITQEGAPESLYDMTLFSREAAMRGYDVHNIDLINHKNAPAYWIQQKGKSEAIRYLCRQIFSRFHNAEYYTPLMVHALLSKALPGNPITYEEVSEACKEYVPILKDLPRWMEDHNKRRENENDIREEFMVTCLNDFPGDRAVVLVHTTHLLSILNKTKHVLQFFEEGPMEKAEKTLLECTIPSEELMRMRYDKQEKIAEVLKK